MPEVPAPPAANPSSEDLAREAAALVNAWLSANIHNSPLSRNSEAWNCLHAALPALIDSIADLNRATLN